MVPSRRIYKMFIHTLCEFTENKKKLVFVHANYKVKTKKKKMGEENETNEIERVAFLLAKIFFEFKFTIH